MRQTGQTSRVPALENDLPYQRWEWRLQRAGWVLLLLFVLAAALGLLGQGGLSHAQAADGALRVGYDRIIRREAPYEYDIGLGARAGEGEARLAFSASCLQEADVERILPEPDSALAGGGGAVTWVFRLDPAAAEKRIRVSLKARKSGLRNCRIAADGGEAAEFRQRALP